MASNPSRAVATTRNAPLSASPPPRTSTSTRRIRALSSATTTVGRASDDVGMLPHGADFHAPVGDVKAHAAAALTAHRFPNDGDLRRAQRTARRQKVALAHLDRAGCDELAEHAGTAGELGDQAPRIGAQGLETLDQQRHGGLGKLGSVGDVARQADRGQEDVGHRAGFRLRIVHHDRDAGTEPAGDRKSTRLNSSHGSISYAVFCLKKKTKNNILWLIDKKNTQTNAYNNYDIII